MSNYYIILKITLLIGIESDKEDSTVLNIILQEKKKEGLRRQVTWRHVRRARVPACYALRHRKERGPRGAGVCWSLHYSEWVVIILLTFSVSNLFESSGWDMWTGKSETFSSSFYYLLLSYIVFLCADELGDVDYCWWTLFLSGRFQSLIIIIIL